MSLWDHNAFTPFGEPVPSTAPPALRVMGGQATAAQLFAAQAAFSQFCTHARLSFVANPTAQGLLPDGSSYRIIDLAGVRTMMLWPAGSSSKALAKSGIWFWKALQSGSYTAANPPKGKFLVNLAKSGGGSSATWELIPFPDPFYSLGADYFAAAIPLNRDNGWKYTYAETMGQYGRALGQAYNPASALGVEMNSVLAQDANKIIILSDWNPQGVEVLSTKGIFNYLVPQDHSKAVDVIPASAQSNIRESVYRFSDPENLSLIYNGKSIFKSLNGKYIAVGVHRITFEDVIMPNGDLGYGYFLLNMAASLPLLIYALDSDNKCSIITTQNTSSTPTASQGKFSKENKDIYIFKIENGSYVLDHIENHNDLGDLYFTPAIATVDFFDSRKFSLSSYTREVVRDVYPSNIGGPAVGPFDLEVKAKNEYRNRDFIGVNNAGEGLYSVTTSVVEYHTSSAGVLDQASSPVGRSLGTFKNRSEIEIYGTNIVGVDLEIDGIYDFGVTETSSYTATSDVRSIVHTIAEIELFVYVRRRVEYTHLSSKTVLSNQTNITPCTDFPICTDSSIVIQCGETQITIDATAVPYSERELTERLSLPWLGMLAGIGDSKFGDYKYGPRDISTGLGTGSPLYPFAGTIFDYAAKKYSASTLGFLTMTGAGVFGVNVSHCFVPETGGVCLCISVPQSEVTTERPVYYFLYDDEAGLREMPIAMQDTIIESLELPPGGLPPVRHMGQI